MAKGKKVRMPSIAFIIARSYPQNIIGCENKLPWRLKTDMRFFRQVTDGHAIIMGRKTFDSIGHALPNRFNIVLSRQPGNNARDLLWVNDRESALFFADIHSILEDKKQVIIIGGAEIYGFFSDLVNKIYLTEVFTKLDKGDAYFDFSFDYRKWRTLEENEYPASSHDEYPFRISIIERRINFVRQRNISDFLSIDDKEKHWLETNKIMDKVNNFESIPEEQFSLPMVAA